MSRANRENDRDNTSIDWPTKQAELKRLADHLHRLLDAQSRRARGDPATQQKIEAMRQRLKVIEWSTQTDDQPH